MLLYQVLNLRWALIANSLPMVPKNTTEFICSCLCEVIKDVLFLSYADDVLIDFSEYEPAFIFSLVCLVNQCLNFKIINI